MYIENKIMQPLNLKISHHGCEILAPNEQNLPLIPGAMFGGQHYGFVLIVDSDGKQSEEVYPTQFRIVGVEIKDAVLLIYEEHKYFPWKFDMKGLLQSEATFCLRSQRDLDFLAKNYGIVGEKAIEEVNAYRKRK